MILTKIIMILSSCRTNLRFEGIYLDFKILIQVAFKMLLRSKISIFLSGGSPYPRMDGRKIANMLQEGYRMPKPQHVDDEL